MRAKKAIIIAAGRGRRLMPYTTSMPKCLVPIGGRSILEIQLDAMVASGVEEIIVVRGYLGDVLEERCLTMPYPIRFVDNDNWEHNNILESLFCAHSHLDDDVLISYSDIVYTPAVVASVQACSADFALVIDRDFHVIYEGRDEHPLEEAEVVDLDESGSVANVGKRATPADAAWGEFIGLCKLSHTGAKLFRSTWAELCANTAPDDPFVRALTFRQAYLTDLLQHLIDHGQPMMPVAIRGQWREIDTNQDLQRAVSFFGALKPM
jgi:choline kinase